MQVERYWNSQTMRTIRPGVIRISTGELPAGERIAYCREVFGRKLFRVDIEPLPDSQVCADIILHALPGLNILSGTIGCGVRTARTRELVSDGNDDLLLTVNLRGRLCVSQRGQQLVLDDKVAVLSSLGEMGEVIRTAPGHGFTLQVPRSAIVPIVRCIDAAVMRLIPSSSPALQLLTQYVTLLQNSRALVDPLLRQIAVKTIYDLVFAAIIAPREHGAFGQGAATARLAAIRADIIDNLVAGAAVCENGRRSPRSFRALRSPSIRGNRADFWQFRRRTTAKASLCIADRPDARGITDQRHRAPGWFCRTLDVPSRISTVLR
jgi:hypothetical protein